MNRRGAGVAFLAIGAFLFAVRYVTDAMLLTQNGGMGSYDFRMALYESGVFLLLLSILFFILGVVYFILGDFPAAVQRYKEKAKENWAERQEANRAWEESLNSDSDQDEKPST
ncbi:hypothetical protein RJP21_14320 [Paenibacillus sp. VCA1]|uniref:hypothetical protein n=1 Tax=Paenibacillus sp. VCA1 TaxID=3039148 RepID=UPI002871ADBF|nr:hypothetical protein [Paenibacillus sp. VCA1]MDR9854787.1 hypothetical protein [Paenibacillus sp. VCA1]